MPNDLKILTMASRLTEHAARRQAIVTENIAHADTPGYKARDLKPFSSTYAARSAIDEDAALRLAATRPGHIGMGYETLGARIEEQARTGAASPNGNTVSLEDQMIRGAELRMEHDLALGVWRKSIDILRAGLGRSR